MGMSIIRNLGGAEQGSFNLGGGLLVRDIREIITEELYSTVPVYQFEMWATRPVQITKEVWFSVAKL